MPPDSARDDISALMQRLANSDRAALSRLLSLAAADLGHEAIANGLGHRSATSAVIAFTGGAGVGKSSLLGALTRQLAERGESLGVLACDPQSPVTGGALLGDRCRIADRQTSDRIFVRSLSTVSGRQGIARHAEQMLMIMQAFGFDRIFIETVGAGQGDIAVRELADVVVLVVQPQTGDDLQWEKAGILELADVVVVNKADLPGADQIAADLREQLSDRNIALARTSVLRGEGITELVRVLDEQAKPQARAPVESHGEPPDSSAGLAASASSSHQNFPDAVLTQIADYVCGPVSFSDEAWQTARLCLLDSLGCALLALNFEECTRLLGPIVPGAELTNGARVPGTSYVLDPVTAAFNIGCLIRWLDYNDTWLAAEWGHPSDNFGGIIAVADFLNRQADSPHSLTVRDVLTAAIKAYEVQGVLALENAFNRIGLDHVILVRVATTAVVTHLLGGTRQQVIDALSNAWLDGGALRTYRHAPNTGSRKSWAAGDATRRGVQLALWTMAGEMGYPTALSAPQWGLHDVLLGGSELVLPRLLGCYVMENVLFKVAFPAEFHAQTAAEAAIQLHPQVAHRLDEIDRIRIETQEAAMRIINKTGPLKNPADRDHCLQYIVAVALINGALTSDHYADAAAADQRIDRLRQRMEVVEEPRYSRDYLDPNKRSIANAVQVCFVDGTSTDRVEIEYPLGHRRRRQQARGLLRDKFQRNAETRFDPDYVQELLAECFDSSSVDDQPVSALIDRFVIPGNTSAE